MRSDYNGTGTPFDLVVDESTTNMTVINDTVLQTTAGEIHFKAHLKRHPDPHAGLHS